MLDGLLDEFLDRKYISSDLQEKYKDFLNSLSDKELNELCNSAYMARSEGLKAQFNETIHYESFIYWQNYLDNISDYSNMLRQWIKDRINKPNYETGDLEELFRLRNQIDKERKKILKILKKWSYGIVENLQVNWIEDEEE